MKQHFFTAIAFILEAIALLLFEIPGFILSGIGLFISDTADSLKHIS